MSRPVNNEAAYGEDKGAEAEGARAGQEASAGAVPPQPGISPQTEDEFLAGWLDHVKEIQEDPFDWLDWWNIVEEVDMETFKENIKKLREHVENTMATAYDKRGGVPDWAR